MSVSDPFHAGQWVERLLLLRERIVDGASAWNLSPNLPWETADPESNPVRFEAVGLDSRWNLSRSEAGFVGGILRQLTDSLESPFGYTFAASAWMYLGKPNKGRAVLRHALVADPCYVPAYVVRAILHSAAGNPEAREDDLEKALGLDPNCVPALTATAMFEPDRDPLEADLHLDRAVRLSPKYADAFTVRGLIAQAVGDEEDSLNQLNRALELDPANALAYQLRAGLWAAMLEFQNAIDDLGAYCDLAPSSVESRMEKIALNLYLDQFSEAESEATRLIHKYPRTSLFFRTRAQIRKLFGRPDDVLDDLDAAIEIDPEEPDAYIERGLVRHEMGEYALAIEDYDRALAITPENIRALTSRGRGLLATG